jgi:aquaporin Z
MQVLQMLLVQKALAEMTGTFAMIFVGVSSIILSEKYPHLFPPIVIPIAWGAIIALMIAVWGGTSGAHFNPAVTLALTIAKRSPVALLPLYWGSQLFGGLIAMAALEGIKKL